MRIEKNEKYELRDIEGGSHSRVSIPIESLPVVEVNT